jgi:hypothetical protein
MATEATTSAENPTTLVLWDFDWSLINQNSDFWPVAQLFGDVYATELSPKWRDMKAEMGMSHCLFQDEVTFKELFTTYGKTREEYQDVLKGIPVFDENLMIIKSLFNYAKRSKTDSAEDFAEMDVSAVEVPAAVAAKSEESKGDDDGDFLRPSVLSKLTSSGAVPPVMQLIVSAANTILCDNILRAKGIAHVFSPYDERVFTNAAHWEEVTDDVADLKLNVTDDKSSIELIDDIIAALDKSEKRWRLRVRSFNAHRDQEIACPICRDVDICKGGILLKDVDPSISSMSLKNLLAAKILESDAREYDRVVYVGDGANDFCPATRLTEFDFLFARKGKALSRLLEDEEMRSRVKATVMLWEDGKGLLHNFKTVFPFVTFA